MVSTAVLPTTASQRQCTRRAVRPPLSAVLLRWRPISAERSRLPGQSASPMPQLAAPGAVRHTNTGCGARTWPCRCVRPAVDPLPPQPGPAARLRPRRRRTSHPVAARDGWHQDPSCPKASGPEGRDQSLSRHLAARRLCGPPAGIGRGQPPRRWLKLGDVARRIRPPSARHPPASLRGPRSARARSASGGRGRRS